MSLGAATEAAGSTPPPLELCWAQSRFVIEISAGECDEAECARADVHSLGC